MPLEEAGRPGDLWLIEGPLGGLRSGGRCGAVRAPARLKVQVRGLACQSLRQRLRRRVSVLIVRQRGTSRQWLVGCW